MKLALSWSRFPGTVRERRFRVCRPQGPGLSLLAVLLNLWIPGAWAGEVASAAATPAPQSRQNLWRESVSLCSQGDFSAAARLLRSASIEAGDSPLGRVTSWLADYEKLQEQRLAFDRQEHERYVGYTRECVEKKLFTRALDWLYLARDTATFVSDQPDRRDPEGAARFMATDWVVDLLNTALEEANQLRARDEWQEAWKLYIRLVELHEHSAPLRELERDAASHVRLDAMFDEKRDWREGLEQIRWDDAKRALEYLEAFYVRPVDFRDIAVNGLRQVLLLSESSAAAKQLPGLQNEFDKAQFQARVRERLDQLRAARNVDRLAAVQAFRRIIKDINPETARIPEELLIHELMRGALDPLDEFTSIIWPEDSSEFDKHTQGRFIGVGISIIKNSADEIEVVSPIEDTPAYDADIRPGDVITAVDGATLKGYSISRVVSTITGEANTRVVLTIRRGSETLEFPLVRREVKIHSVKGLSRNPDNSWDHWLDPAERIAYVRLTNFQSNSRKDLYETIANLKAEGMRGLVFDLRGNPGGLLTSAFEVSAMFLGEGERVVSTRSRNRQDDQVYDCPIEGPFRSLPLVILTDEQSASASEIVAGAVRDNNRGVVIGERTFGKFSVQNLIPLDQSRAMQGAKLKITTARYHLPKGASLHKEPGAANWGVEPDVPVKLVRWERINNIRMRRERDIIRRGGKPTDVAPASPDAASHPKDEKATDPDATSSPDESSKASDAPGGALMPGGDGGGGAGAG